MVKQVYTFKFILENDVHSFARLDLLDSSAGIV